MSDLYERVLDGVTSVISDLNEPLIEDRVYNLFEEDETAIQFPCCAVALEDAAAEEDEDLNFLQNYVRYPVLVLILDRDSVRRPEARPPFLQCRKTLMDKFRSLLTLPGCPECFNVWVRPRFTITQRLPRYQNVSSGFVVIAWTSENRPRAQG